jgi:signal peptidase I
MSSDRCHVDGRGAETSLHFAEVLTDVRSRKLWLILGAFLLVSVSLLRTQYCLTLVSGESMEPGLRTGDLLLVDQLAYRDAAPKRGDIILSHSPTGLIVKRVVGLPGEWIELRQGRLYIDDLPLAESYDIELGMLSLGKGRLFDEKYGVLGDNRSVPSSLSVHAIIARDQIVGKVIRSIRLRPNRWSAGGLPIGDRFRQGNRRGQTNITARITP